MTRSRSAEDMVDGWRLQQLLLSAEPGETGLYWRQVDPLAVSIAMPNGLLVKPGSILRLDTFLNTFYGRYWHDLAGLDSLELRVETSGHCLIRIVRRSVSLKQCVVAEVSAQDAYTRSTLKIDLDRCLPGNTVLHVEIEARSGSAVLHEGAWRTGMSPCNDVRLAIVTCSFGREHTLVDNIRRVADVVARHPAITEFLVVQQGTLQLAAFAPFATLASRPGGKLRLAQQANFGGTGGFVRGILEALGTPATHVLLLDDDIRIEPWAIERLLALLSHLKAPTAIGGQMLDLQKPTRLHASHEQANLETLELTNPYTNIDLTTADIAALFGQRQRSNYNAWWFCCIPLAKVRSLGLPMPMFLRHDDVEYGVRTSAAGVPVVTMPGICVWHEPFTKKAKALIVYYEHRNFLVTAALHDRIRRLRFALIHWQNAWGALKRHRFEYCWARCRAMDDFLAGPDTIFVDLPARHRDLIAAQARMTLMTMASVRYHADAERRRRMGWRLSLTRLVLFGTRGLCPAEEAFAVTIRELFWAILRSCVALLWRASQAEHAYRRNAAFYASAAYWRRLLHLPSDRL